MWGQRGRRSRWGWERLRERDTRWGEPLLEPVSPEGGIEKRERRVERERGRERRGTREIERDGGGRGERRGRETEREREREREGGGRGGEDREKRAEGERLSSDKPIWLQQKSLGLNPDRHSSSFTAPVNPILDKKETKKSGLSTHPS